jgi:membrane protein implicated in regulation of membrane protease activity
MANNLLPRIGTFFMWIGLGLLVLFLASIFSGGLQLQYFFLSAGAFFLGTVLRRRRLRQPSGRFSSINRLRGKNPKDRDDE